ncbi:MAG: hypothetical protein ACXAC2_00270 [Candidatus Kariarchaeaceae archaeon]|jgi:hypothetical protein
MESTDIIDLDLDDLENQQQTTDKPPLIIEGSKSCAFCVKLTVCAIFKIMTKGVTEADNLAPDVIDIEKAPEFFSKIANDLDCKEYLPANP